MRFRIIVFSIFAILVISGFGSSNMEMINHLNVFVISPDSDMELIDLSDSLETALATNNKLAQAYNTKIMPPIIPSGLSVAPLETDTSFSPDGVIGDDDQFLINDTTQFPYSAVVLLEIEFEEHNGHVEEASCTGWMLGSSTVVTAGHCVYEPGDDIYAVDIFNFPRIQYL